MSLLSRDAILQLVDVKTEDVHVPEWDATVRVKGMTAAERDAFEAGSLVGKGKNRETNLQNLRARLLVRTIVDEKGQRIFADGDAMALGEKSAAALDRLFAVATRLSGIGESDLEELAGNSEAGPSAGSSSD